MDQVKNQEEEYTCMECGADVGANDLVCPKCGTTFDEQNTTADESLLSIEDELLGQHIGGVGL
ncbi:MAG: hypothetical protein A2V93_02650 [Ignavibacteria bacterium RBG_16_34_14]|nr:MAG: hypothetical protein A2V93_02650 [Ignavibacteria bacterium RBG_16_34_14]